jgi:hypothetical protein
MRHYILFTAILVCLAVFTIPCTGQEVAYSHKIALEKMTFHWKVDDTFLHVKLVAETTGWVGIGFEPVKMMKGANFVIGYVKNGQAKASDHYGTSFNLHREDTKLGGQNNVTNVAGKEENGTTEIRFTIPLTSDDAKDNSLNIAKETTVLLAYGSGRDSFRTRHTFNTALIVNLKTGEYKE